MQSYDFLLDFFPLVDEIVYESPVLGSVLQSIALDMLLDNDLTSKKKISVLLQLASDLGYTSLEVVTFLQNQLKE